MLTRSYDDVTLDQGTKMTSKSVLFYLHRLHMYAMLAVWHNEREGQNWYLRRYSHGFIKQELMTVQPYCDTWAPPPPHKNPYLVKGIQNKEGFAKRTQLIIN